jgi:hypothetical protein
MNQWDPTDRQYRNHVLLFQHLLDCNEHNLTILESFVFEALSCLIFPGQVMLSEIPSVLQDIHRAP